VHRSGDRQEAVASSAAAKRPSDQDEGLRAVEAVNSSADDMSSAFAQLAGDVKQVDTRSGRAAARQHRVSGPPVPTWQALRPTQRGSSPTTSPAPSSTRWTVGSSPRSRPGALTDLSSATDTLHGEDLPHSLSRRGCHVRCRQGKCPDRSGQRGEGGGVPHSAAAGRWELRG